MFLDRTNISASLHPFKNCITSLNKPQTESSAEVTTLQNIKFLSKERTSCRNRNEIDTVHPMAPWSSHLHCTKDAWRNNWRQRAGDNKVSGFMQLGFLLLLAPMLRFRSWTQCKVPKYRGLCMGPLQPWAPFPKTFHEQLILLNTRPLLPKQIKSPRNLFYYILTWNTDLKVCKSV